MLSRVQAGKHEIMDCRLGHTNPLALQSLALKMSMLSAKLDVFALVLLLATM